MPASTLTRQVPETLTGLRATLLAAGFTAESPETLDPEGEHLARLERQD